MELQQFELPNMNKVKELEEIAINRIREYAIEDYYLAFSGGKDSTVLKELTCRSGKSFDAHYSNTTCDPPQLTRFIREVHPDVIWENPLKTIYEEMVYHGFPIRQRRWCCELFKENGGEGRFVLTGIRHAESARRSNRKMMEFCTQGKGKKFLHPIIDWTTADVWAYIKYRNLPYCSLYDEGFKRIGCVLCPMETTRQTQIMLVKFPQIARAWRLAFERLWNRHTEGTDKYKSAEEMWQWWLSRKGQKADNGQCSMFI